jgi:uncharacterized membrane protein
MAVIARIIGLSLLTAGLGAGLGYALFGTDRGGTGAFLLACVGALVGALAGTAGEIVAVMRQRGRSEKTFD